MEEAGLDETSVLKQLLAEMAETDLAGSRTAALRTVEKKRKRAFSESMEALDTLLVLLDAREREIAAGEPGMDARASSQSAAPEATEDGQADVDQEAPNTTATSERPTVAETPAVVAEPAESLSPHQCPTVIIDAIEGSQVEHYGEETPGLEDAPPESPEPSSRRAATVEMEAQADEPSAESGLAESIGPVQEEAPTPGWTRPAELLFDDLLRLFRLGDSDGALISLERLLTAMDLNDDLVEFIRVNEDRLLDLYQAILGPWEKVPQHSESPEPMPPSFFATPKIERIMGRIDGRSSLEDLMSDDTLTRLETIAVVNQLLRAKAVTMELGIQ